MTTNSTYQLYEPRRTEHALCCDFPADEVLIRGLHTLEKYWWNKGWQSSLSAVRVMNAVHYVATYMFNMPTRTQSEYDQMLYDYVGQDRMLMRAAMLALPEMLRRIALPQARSYRALMMEDRPEEFYEGVSLYEQWLEGATQYYREEEFLIDVMDEVNTLRLQNQKLTNIYNNLLNEKNMMEKEMKQAPVINCNTYIAEQHNDIHDNNNCNIYATPQQDAQQSETSSEEWFKYIHPSITHDAERKQIHLEVQNLVRNFPLTEICRYLQTLSKNGRIYINVKPEAMFAELHRLGMPGEENKGYTFKTFQNNFGLN